jgi:hypothetical protein
MAAGDTTHTKGEVVAVEFVVIKKKKRERETGRLRESSAMLFRKSCRDR